MAGTLLGHTVVSADLIMKAPEVVELRIPAALAEGRSLVVSGDLEPEHGSAGSVQLTAGLTRPTPFMLSPSHPIITATGGDTDKRINAGLDDFRDLFPASICYPQIVPVDEVVTLALYFREDEPMQRLMLNEKEKAELDRLWDELMYITGSRSKRRSPTSSSSSSRRRTGPTSLSRGSRTNQFCWTRWRRFARACWRMSLSNWKR